MVGYRAHWLVGSRGAVIEAWPVVLATNILLLALPPLCLQLLHDGEARWWQQWSWDRSLSPQGHRQASALAVMVTQGSGGCRGVLPGGLAHLLLPWHLAANRPKLGSWILLHLWQYDGAGWIWPLLLVGCMRKSSEGVLVCWGGSALVTKGPEGQLLATVALEARRRGVRRC